MDTAVEFTSNLFKPFLPEDRQVNPDVHGAELAFWLARELAERGVVTSYPNYEDWGWFIEYSLDSGEEYMLACSNVSGHPGEWRCNLYAHKKSLFGKKADLQLAAPMLDALRAALENEPQVQNIRWSVE